MRKLGVRLARLNGVGICVGIIDNEMDSVELFYTMSHQDPKKAIDQSIKKLNSVIKKLEKLKKKETPFSVKVQNSINGFEY